MNLNRRTIRCCAVRLAVGLSVVIVGCGTQASYKSGSTVARSDLAGTWSWTQDPWHGEFMLEREGDSYTGTLDDNYEGTYGDKIVDVAVAGGHIEFTRDGRYGRQHWEGTLEEDAGALKITDGRWTKQGGCSGTFTAEKQD